MSSDRFPNIATVPRLALESEHPIEIALWIAGLAGVRSIDLEFALLLDDALLLFKPRARA